MADPAQLEEADKASFFGYMGLAGALVFANLGAAIGTYRSGVGICHLGILRPDKIIKSVIPVIMADIPCPLGYTLNKTSSKKVSITETQTATPPRREIFP